MNEFSACGREKYHGRLGNKSFNVWSRRFSSTVVENNLKMPPNAVRFLSCEHMHAWGAHARQYVHNKWNKVLKSSSHLIDMEQFDNKTSLGWVLWQRCLVNFNFCTGEHLKSPNLNIVAEKVKPQIIERRAMWIHNVCFKILLPSGI